MKRGNDNAQQSKEQFEAEEDDEGEEAGTFRRASAEVLAGRKIIKVKRGNSSSGGDAAAKPAMAPFGLPAAIPKPSPFAAGFPPSLTPAAPVAASPKEPDATENSEFGKKVRKLNEAFLKWAEKQIETHPLSIWKEGVKDYIKHYEMLEDKYLNGSNGSSAKGSTATAAPQTAAGGNGFSLPAKIAAPAPTPAVAAPAPFGGFSATPASSASAPAPTASASAFSGFSFGAAAAAPPPAAPVETKPAAAFAGFSFGAAAPAPAAPAAAPKPAGAFSGFSFGAAATAPAPAAPAPASNGFSFGAASSSAAAPSTSFGGFGSSAMPSFGGFGSSATAAPAAAAAGGDEEEGGEDEGEPILEPEKVLRNAADTDEILHEVPCKLFSFSVADKEWKDTGKGTFRITRDAVSQKQRMLVRNQVGRINFNAGFFPSMKIEKVQKRLKFAALVAVEETGLNSEGKAVVRTEMKNFMIQLKPEDLDATQKKMESAVAGSK